MLIDMEKDETQIKKAKIKASAIQCVIPELIRLNNELDDNERKHYTILLDYISFDEYFKFIVDIVRGYSLERESLMKIHFSLKDKEEGLQLLDKIRDCYMEHSQLSYTALSINPRTGITESFEAVSPNKIDLEYRAHTLEESDKMRIYEEGLYKNPTTSVKIQKKVNS